MLHNRAPELYFKTSNSTRTQLLPLFNQCKFQQLFPLQEPHKPSIVQQTYAVLVTSTTSLCLAPIEILFKLAEFVWNIRDPAR
jgi:hypothetical protein